MSVDKVDQSERQEGNDDEVKMPNDMNAIAASEASNNQYRPQIFKLNVDCFEYLFEWLSLKELLKLRCTCKPIKLIVEYYIKLNYLKLQRLNVMYRWSIMDADQLQLKCLEWIKSLRISTIELNDIEIDSIKNVLNQLEGLKLDDVQINADFYETILKHCPRLKYLGLSMEEMPTLIIGTGNEWLLRRYPTLEHFHLRVRSYGEYNCALMTFFERNPNIRTFSTSSGFLLSIHEFLLRLHVNFDRLNIFIKNDLSLVCKVVNNLYVHQFYKQLHLYGDISMVDLLSWDEAKYLWALPNLVKLDFDLLPENYSIPNGVESIREISAYDGCPNDIMGELAAQNFINLRRIDILKSVYLKDFLAFVSYAPRLEQIRVWNILKPKTRHFVALNERREKLCNARKIKMYVDEKTYLKIKWKAKLNLSMIELRPIETCEMDYLFYWSNYMR